MEDTKDTTGFDLAALGEPPCLHVQLQDVE